MRPVVFVVPLSLLPERMLACPVQVFVTWTARPVPHQAHSQNTTVAITLGRPQNHITPRPLAWRDLLFTAHNANIHHKKGTQLAWRPPHGSHNARGKHHRAVLEKESGMDEQMSQAAGSSVEMPVVDGGKLSHPTLQVV